MAKNPAERVTLCGGINVVRRVYDIRPSTSDPSVTVGRITLHGADVYVRSADHGWVELISNPHAYASALGRLGGASKSAAKAEASRQNGKRGGRPKKTT